jgi:hypothetical protein
MPSLPASLTEQPKTLRAEDRLCLWFLFLRGSNLYCQLFAMNTVRKLNNSITPEQKLAIRRLSCQHTGLSEDREKSQPLRMRAARSL